MPRKRHLDFREDEMNRKDIETSIKSYSKRLEERKADVVANIQAGSYWAAQIALGECMGFEAVIRELEFQLECMEVNHV